MTNKIKPEGIFKNGDLWYNATIEEEGKTYFLACYPDSNPEDGADYETEEIPERFPFMALTIFSDGTKESECNEYFLQKRIGDSRSGSECQHTRVKRGYCPDCLRKVIQKIYND